MWCSSRLESGLLSGAIYCILAQHWVAGHLMGECDLGGIIQCEDQGEEADTFV